MYTDFEIERIYLGLPFTGSNGNRSSDNGSGERKPPLGTDATDYTHEEIEKLFLGIPFT